jgi:hypothetical protein
MPFDFVWQYQEDDDGEQPPEKSLEIGEPSEVTPLDITIKNILTGKEITIDPIDGATEASTTHYHFKLAFNPGILVNPEQIEIETANWSIHCDSNAITDTLYLLWKGSEIKLLPTQSTEVTLTGVAANSGVHDNSQQQTSFIANFADSPDVTIGWQFKQVMHVISVGTPQFFPHHDNPYATTKNLHLTMVKTTGKSNIPLFVGFVGSNKVLNVHNDTSRLKLRITNTNLTDGDTSNITFHYDSDSSKCSQLVLMLEAGSDNWALGTADEVNDISILIDGDQWTQKGNKEQVNVRNQIKGYKWIFEPKNSNIVLQAQDTILIDLSNITTSKPTGESNLYLSYNYVQGYKDGQFICAIEKSSLQVTPDGKVGIGIHDQYGHDPQIDLAIGDNDTGIKWVSDGNFAIYNNNSETVLFDNNRNVGIGTTSPSAKLDVNGTTKTTDLNVTGNVGIGTNSPSEKLDVNGTTKTTDLNVTGNVGIGTTSPSEKLEVDGTIKANGLEIDGSPIIRQDNDAYIHYEAKSSDQSWYIGTNKKSEGFYIYEGTEKLYPYRLVVKKGGNVGIGTNSPSEKLEVNGGFKIASGNTVTGIPLTKFQHGTFRGVKVYPFKKAEHDFGSNVIDACVALTTSDIQYGDDHHEEDHEIQRIRIALSHEKSGSKVTVYANVDACDCSGNRLTGNEISYVVIASVSSAESV